MNRISVNGVTSLPGVFCLVNRINREQLQSSKVDFMDIGLTTQLFLQLIENTYFVPDKTVD